eukprot:CAMPEP_0204260440 /NCGR_PEP_ID=MMETSP0468-20130131/6337_1 /ASSEMBLY_ACC=CAM_ASM_000383 /TAXON_ID=2969 /ORGANISM="Oxyrrhis marina" /LENGTH=75 /DNA_ID=CAMNT_0051234877 /DNA_START=617 /DNA_END=845 /DNA_ORIENTATION=-
MLSFGDVVARAKALTEALLAKARRSHQALVVTRMCCHRCSNWAHMSNSQTLEPAAALYNRHILGVSDRNSRKGLF